MGPLTRGDSRLSQDRFLMKVTVENGCATDLPIVAPDNGERQEGGLD